MSMGPFDASGLWTFPNIRDILAWIKYFWDIWDSTK